MSWTPLPLYLPSVIQYLLSHRFSTPKRPPLALGLQGAHLLTSVNSPVRYPPDGVPRWSAVQVLVAGAGGAVFFSATGGAQQGFGVGVGMYQGL